MLAVERGELAHDALARFPQLLVAPALLAILWSSLFERFAPLDVRELMRAHVELLLGTRDHAMSARRIVLALLAALVVLAGCDNGRSRLSRAGSRPS